MVKPDIRLMLLCVLVLGWTSSFFGTAARLLLNIYFCLSGICLHLRAAHPPRHLARHCFCFDERTMQVYDGQVGLPLHGPPGLRQRWRNRAGPPLDRGGSTPAACRPLAAPKVPSQFSCCCQSNATDGKCGGGKKERNAAKCAFVWETRE